MASVEPKVKRLKMEKEEEENKENFLSPVLNGLSENKIQVVHNLIEDQSTCNDIEVILPSLDEFVDSLNREELEKLARQFLIQEIVKESEKKQESEPELISLKNLTVNSSNVMIKVAIVDASKLLHPSNHSGFFARLILKDLDGMDILATFFWYKNKKCPEALTDTEFCNIFNKLQLGYFSFSNFKVIQGNPDFRTCSHECEIHLTEKTNIVPESLNGHEMPIVTYEKAEKIVTLAATDGEKTFMKEQNKKGKGKADKMETTRDIIGVLIKKEEEVKYFGVNPIRRIWIADSENEYISVELWGYYALMFDGEIGDVIGLKKVKRIVGKSLEFQMEKCGFYQKNPPGAKTEELLANAVEIVKFGKKITSRGLDWYNESNVNVKVPLQNPLKESSTYKEPSDLAQTLRQSKKYNELQLFWAMNGAIHKANVEAERLGQLTRVWYKQQPQKMGIYTKEILEGLEDLQQNGFEVAFSTYQTEMKQKKEKNEASTSKSNETDKSSSKGEKSTVTKPNVIIKEKTGKKGAKK